MLVPTNTDNGLKKRVGNTAFTFRGYNITNLGRTLELLAHPDYGPFVRRHLDDASRICTRISGRKVNLLGRIHRKAKTTLKTYAQDICLIVAVELAQLQILRELFHISIADAKLAQGYSLGEVTALVASGVYSFESIMTPLVMMADDTASLADDVTMGILFSRGPALGYDKVTLLCLEITNEGKGTIAVSTILSPDTVLLMGQGGTLERFKERMVGILPETTRLRKNPNRWPPIHTPIMWQKSIPNRTAVLMEKLPGGFVAPHPPILSCVTGGTDYNNFNSREILHRWVDHPQRVWDVVDKTLASGVETIIHVGPEPNIFPDTFKRIALNVTTQLEGRPFARFGVRAMSRILGRRTWLQRLMSTDPVLLRAPYIEQINLEDWLLEQRPYASALAQGERPA
jgi:[acyl-carrier-protein] S-malonyltransferase